MSLDVDKDYYVLTVSFNPERVSVALAGREKSTIYEKYST